MKWWMKHSTSIMAIFPQWNHLKLMTQRPLFCTGTILQTRHKNMVPMRIKRETPLHLYIFVNSACLLVLPVMQSPLFCTARSVSAEASEARGEAKQHSPFSAVLVSVTLSLICSSIPRIRASSALFLHPSWLFLRSSASSQSTCPNVSRNIAAGIVW